jgi:hypothetical protein
MKKLGILFISIVLISCQSDVKKEDLNKLNGYWEIKQVKLASGEKKDYKVNETIDYFELKDNAGFRQKVMPQMNGTYTTNNLKEIISISNKDGDYFINYATNFGKWKEEIIELEDSILVLKNKDNLEYHYKKQIPFSLK